MKGIPVKPTKINDINFIENAAKTMLGFDQATIQSEMEEARIEWGQTLAASSAEATAQMKDKMDQGFAAVMAQIRAENISPVTEEMYEEEERRARKKVVSLKKYRRMGLIVAVATAGILGSSMMATGHKAYQKKSTGFMKNENVWDDNSYVTKVGELEHAYLAIEEQLGINVIVLDYIPEGIKFDNVVIDKGHATIEFSHYDYSLHLREAKYPVLNVSSGLFSDKGNLDVCHNMWLNIDIPIIENQLQDGSFEYIVEIDQNDSFYYLSGKMNKDDFIKIVENLRFLK